MADILPRQTVTDIPFSVGFSAVSGFGQGTPVSSALDSRTTITLQVAGPTSTSVSSTPVAAAPTSDSTASTASEHHGSIKTVLVVPIIAGVLALLATTFLLVWWLRRRRVQRQQQPYNSRHGGAEKRPDSEKGASWSDDGSKTLSEPATAVPKERLSVIQRGMRRQRCNDSGCQCFSQTNPFIDPLEVEFIQRPALLPPKPESPIPRPGDTRLMDEDEIRGLGILPPPPTSSSYSRVSSRDMADIQRAFELEEQQERERQQQRHDLSQHHRRHSYAGVAPSQQQAGLPPTI